MAKYRKKPVVIEAEQWDGTFKDMERIKNSFPDMQTLSQSYNEKDNTVFGWLIETLEGGHHVSPFDFIIRGIKGEYYPCKSDIFEQTYELVET